MLTTAGKLTVMTESGSGTLAGGAQADGFADWEMCIRDSPLQHPCRGLFLAVIRDGKKLW